MKLTQAAWNDYISRLARLNRKAGQLMREYMEQNPGADTDTLIRYACALVTKYGEGSAELACQMYDALAEAQGVSLPAAEPAAPSDYGEVAKMVNATKDSPALLQSGVSRMVKQAGADTTLHNALRDGAEWAWVPHGDACPFCRMLASNGWQKASRKALEGGHAEHIHANCDCEYAVRFDRGFDVSGYDPEAYYRQYRQASGDLNKMRRIDYAARKDAINAQKRAAYAVRKGSTESEKSAKINIVKSTLANTPINPVTKEPYQPHEIKITDAQFGKKIGKHTSDYGMNPAVADDRGKMKTIITDIVNNAEERFYGEWRGQEYPVLFHVKGDDVVIESSSGEFVTILKGGTTNVRVENARKSKV